MNQATPKDDSVGQKFLQLQKSKEEADRRKREAEDQTMLNVVTTICVASLSMD